MTVVVDTNIFFSAVISPNGNIARLLTHPDLTLQRISTHYAMVELFKHHPKIIKVAKRPLSDVIEQLYGAMRYVQFYNETLIETAHWQEAERLTADVDNFDVSYVALALQTDGWLWTGDKPLINHLRLMGFERVLNTQELTQKLGL